MCGRGWVETPPVCPDTLLGLLGQRSEDLMAVSLPSHHPQCFLNAVLQCLSSTRPLRDFCLRRDFRQEVPGGGRAQELTEGGGTNSRSLQSSPLPPSLPVLVVLSSWIWPYPFSLVSTFVTGLLPPCEPSSAGHFQLFIVVVSPLLSRQPLQM